MSGDTLFPTFEQGELRDEGLAYFRNGLRSIVNPQTGVPFTEPEIAAAVADPSRWWAEMNAIDLVLLTSQARALWFSDQVWPDRAATEFLRERHAPLRGLTPLPAAGGSGRARGVAPIGAVFFGSTDLPDDAAHYLLDNKGKRYQVLLTTTATADQTTLTLKAIDTGRDTNLVTGTILRWANGPLGAEDFTTLEQLKGGGPAETDAELGKRIGEAIRYKQGGANAARLRALAKGVDSAVLDAFIYACAYDAGSVHIAITGKRQEVTGPLVQVAPSGTVAVVGAFLTPPGTRELPGTPTVIVSTVQAQPLDVSLEIDLAFVDESPWPYASATDEPAIVTNVASTTSITVLSDSSEPLGGTPSLMVWLPTTSKFEVLKVASVVDIGPGEFTVTLTDAPSVALAADMLLSPELSAARRGQIEDAVAAYFDSLGPGELVSDERLSRAGRFPEPASAWPSAFSLTELAGYLKATMGAAVGALGVRLLDPLNVIPEVPDVPENPTLGPKKFTINHLGVYPR